MQTACFGRADMRISKPFSLREFIEDVRNPTQRKNPKLFASTDILPALGWVAENGKTLVDSQQSRSFQISRQRDVRSLAFKLGYRVLYECNAITTVLPASIVATVLLTHYQRGISMCELQHEVMRVKRLIQDRGGKVADIRDDNIEVIVETVLGSIVSDNQLVKWWRHDRMMLGLYSPKERMELNVFRNQLIHNFVSEGIIACCVYACENENKRKMRQERTNNIDHSEKLKDDIDMNEIDEEQYKYYYNNIITKQRLLKRVGFLAKLLKFEFIYRPSMGLIDNFENTLDLATQRGIFKINILTKENGETEEIISVRSKKLNDSGTHYSGIAQYLFLCSLFWHYIDSYWLCALGLIQLLPKRVLPEKDFITRLQSVAENLYFDGQLDLYEAIARDTLQNALTLFADWNVVEFLHIEGDGGSQDRSRGNRIIRLNHEYQSKSKIIELIEGIGDYRKSLKAYRSRRFTAHKSDVTNDSIRLMEEYIRLMREEKIISWQPNKTK